MVLNNWSTDGPIGTHTASSQMICTAWIPAFSLPVSGTTPGLHSICLCLSNLMLPEQKYDRLDSFKNPRLFSHSHEAKV